MKGLEDLSLEHSRVRPEERSLLFLSTDYYHLSGMSVQVEYKRQPAGRDNLYIMLTLNVAIFLALDG